MDKRLEPGHCWVSGKPVVEILANFPAEHPLAGHVMRTGKTLPECAKVTILLLDGCLMTISVHQDHIDEINLNELWHMIHEKEYHECTHRQYLPNYDAEKCEQAHQHQIKRLCPPLAILDIQKSDDIRVEL